MSALGKRLFHVSEQANIGVFEPRPSPSYFKEIEADVVFAISETLLPNYLLPRDCPRVTYYAGRHTTQHDRDTFLGTGNHIICVPVEWRARIIETVVYCYEFPPKTFVLLDKNAGYYISYQKVKPTCVTVISDCLAALQERGVEIRFVTDILQLSEPVKNSSLNYSLIRMRNA